MPLTCLHVSSEVADAAPVEPAETNASALPSLTNFTPTIIEESFFFLYASSGFSSISTICDAWTI